MGDVWEGPLNGVNYCFQQLHVLRDWKKGNMHRWGNVRVKWDV